MTKIETGTTKSSTAKRGTQATGVPPTSPNKRSSLISSEGRRRYAAQELLILSDFQDLIMEMQLKAVEYINKNPNSNGIEDTLKRIDKMIEIFEHFDRFYYHANYYQQRCVQKEQEIMALNNALLEKQAEIDKMLKSLKWNEA